jgi:hypothetical protein
VYIDHFCIFLVKTSLQIFCPFLDLGFVFLLSCKSSFYIPNISLLLEIQSEDIFFQPVDLKKFFNAFWSINIHTNFSRTVSLDINVTLLFFQLNQKPQIAFFSIILIMWRDAMNYHFFFTEHLLWTRHYIFILSNSHSCPAWRVWTL